jgi:hypothetical protein
MILPLALVTAARGLRAQYDRHVRAARWTFPLWLYVSVTGVVIYLMLYQMYEKPPGYPVKGSPMQGYETFSPRNTAGLSAKESYRLS